MHTSRRRVAFSDVLVAVLATLAVFMGIRVVWRMVVVPDDSASDVSVVRDWRQIAVRGLPLEDHGAPIVVTLFTDFGCEACRKLDAELLRLRSDLDARVDVRVHLYPVSDDPAAIQAAALATCAHQLGAFKMAFDAFWASGGLPSDADVAEVERVSGLVNGSLSECARQPRIESAIDSTIALAQSLGLEGTPTLLVNGRMVFGYRAGRLLRMVERETAQRDAPGAGVRRDSAGVTIVEHSVGELPLAWLPDTVWSLRGEDFDIDVDTRLLRAGFATDERDQWYVLDRFAPQVLRFGEDAAFLGTSLRRGAGPAEVLDPVGVTARPGEGFALLDFGKLKLIQSDGAGRDITERSLHDIPADSRLFVREGAVFYLTSTRTPTADRVAIVRDNGDTTVVLRGWSRPVAPATSFLSCGLQNVVVAPLFQLEAAWTVSSSNLVVASTHGYVIDFVDSTGSVRLSLRRDLSPLRVTQEMAEAAALQQPLRGSGGCVVPPSEAVERRGFAPVLQVVRRIAIAPSGQLWVERNAPPGSDRRIDIFRSSGEFLGTLPSGFPFPLQFFRDGSFLAAATSEEGDGGRIARVRVSERR